MIVWNRFALAAASAILSSFVAGCAGQTSSAVPYAAPGLAAFDGDQLGRAGGRAYLYVSDAGAGDVQIFSWPKPTTPVATLTGFSEPQGMCNDGKNVYITSTTAAAIVEYAGGATSPLRTIDDPDGLPVGCSVDPVTGDLAVSNILSKSYGQGSIDIYSKAKGKPREIKSNDIFKLFWLQYDGSSNLFITGLNSEDNSVYAEIAADSKRVKVICPELHVNALSGLSWDGTHIVLPGTYRSQQGLLRLKGCKQVGFTPLDGSDFVQFDIYGNRLVVADAGDLDAEIFRYPQGGSPIATLHGFSQPIGVTIVPSN